MKTATLKKELHNAIDCIDDNTILEAVYTLLNKNIYEYELTKDQKKELDRRLELLDKGDLKTTPYKKALKEIREKLFLITGYKCVSQYTKNGRIGLTCTALFNLCLVKNYNYVCLKIIMYEYKK